MKHIKKEKMEKLLFYTAVLISFIAILIYNVMTPLMSDDLLFESSQYNILDIFEEVYRSYKEWTGRVVVHILLRVFMLFPIHVFHGNILSSFTGRKERDKISDRLLCWNVCMGSCSRLV